MDEKVKEEGESFFIKDVSSPFTDNKVYSIGDKIYKYCSNDTCYVTELVAYNNIPQKFIAKLIYQNFNQKLLVLENVQKDIEIVLDKDFFILLKEFHDSTLAFDFCYDFENNNYYSSWKNFIDYKIKIWNSTDFQFSSKNKILFYLQKNEVNEYFDKYCFLHRDIRSDNIGVRLRKLIFFDFELLMIGPPIWDLARIFFDSNFSNEIEKILEEVYSVRKNDLYYYTVLYGVNTLYYYFEKGLDNSKIMENLHEIERML